MALLDERHRSSGSSTDIAADKENATDSEASANKTTTVPLNSNQKKTHKQTQSRYHLLLISIGLALGYLLTYLMTKAGLLKLAVHRKIWNLLLLASFLISGSLGVLLILEKNFGINIPLPLNVLFWHVEVGIGMLVISLFHICWHWRYFWKK